nr:Crp/Fnr family transcriptional regulator [uncultured Devosia sp.]
MTQGLETLLRRLHAIGVLAEDDAGALRGLPFRSVQMSKGEEIVPEGTFSRSCCLVVDGLVHRSKALPDGQRQIFSLHLPGDIPDLHGLHLKLMDHSLVATSHCQVAFISHEAIQSVLQRSTALTGLLWRDTLIDAAAFRAWMLMIGQAEAPVRMAHLFCELYVRYTAVGLAANNGYPLPISQGDLADMLGTSPVHANRTLQDLRGRKLLTFSDGRVEILDWLALVEFGQFDGSYLHIRRDLPT